jgi:hypothetical protein
MNCLYITLFFNIVAGIFQIFIKSWNQLLYPRVIQVCRLSGIKDGVLLLCSSWTSVLPSDNSRHQFFTFCRFITLPQTATICKFPLDVHLLYWEIIWRNAPRIWRDFGSALPFQTRLTKNPVLPMSNEHGSQVKDQGRRQSCHNKHKTFLYRPTRHVSLLSGNSSYIPEVRRRNLVRTKDLTKLIFTSVQYSPQMKCFVSQFSIFLPLAPRILFITWDSWFLFDECMYTTLK